MKMKAFPFTPTFYIIQRVRSMMHYIIDGYLTSLWLYFSGRNIPFNCWTL